VLHATWDDASAHDYGTVIAIVDAIAHLELWAVDRQDGVVRDVFLFWAGFAEGFWVGLVCKWEDERDKAVVLLAEVTDHLVATYFEGSFLTFGSVA